MLKGEVSLVGNSVLGKNGATYKAYQNSIQL